MIMFDIYYLVSYTESSSMLGRWSYLRRYMDHCVVTGGLGPLGGLALHYHEALLKRIKTVYDY